MKKLPYKCQQVFELYGSTDGEISRLEKLMRSLERHGIVGEMYYTHRKDLSYATLVVFLPSTFHAELSEFDPKAFKKWHDQSLPQE